MAGRAGARARPGQENPSAEGRSGARARAGQENPSASSGARARAGRENPSAEGRSGILRDVYNWERDGIGGSLSPKTRPQAQYNKETHLFSAFAEKSGQQIGGSREGGRAAEEKFFASFSSGKRE